MVTNKSGSHNFSAQSSIDDKLVCYMGANATNNTNVSFSQNIIDMEIYIANKEAVDADIKEFQDWVIAQLENKDGE